MLVSITTLDKTITGYVQSALTGQAFPPPTLPAPNIAAPAPVVSKPCGGCKKPSVNGVVLPPAIVAIPPTGGTPSVAIAIAPQPPAATLAAAAAAPVSAPASATVTDAGYGVVAFVGLVVAAAVITWWIKQ